MSPIVKLTPCGQKTSPNPAAVFMIMDFRIAGNLGEPKGETWNQAQENLARKLPCPWGPGTNGQRHCRLGGEMTADQFLAQAEGLLATLRQDFPQFQFSNN